MQVRVNEILRHRWLAEVLHSTAQSLLDVVAGVALFTREISTIVASYVTGVEHGPGLTDPRSAAAFEQL